MSGQCLAVGTEIDIVTDGTLVADTGNIALGGLVLAKRSITEDTEVSGVLVRVLADSLVDRNKSMARVVLGSIDDAVRAVIPIGTGQTLVAGTNNTLLTAVTDGGVLELTAGKAAGHDQVLQAEVAVRAKGESVGRVVTMLISQKAAETQVIVLAVIAADQVAVISFSAASIAHRVLISLSSGIRVLNFGGRKRSRHLWDSLNKPRNELRSGLRCALYLNGGGLDNPFLHLTRGDFLGRAVGDHAVGHDALDQPVTLTAARGTIINTSWAQIVVSMLANAAVIMFIGNGVTTVVAVNAKHATR
jgi:hypothetical protein